MEVNHEPILEENELNYFHFLFIQIILTSSRCILQRLMLNKIVPFKT